jgi:hypothetical protein
MLGALVPDGGSLRLERLRCEGDAVGVRVNRAQQSALRQLRRQRRDLFVYSSTGLQVYESEEIRTRLFMPG